MSGAPTDFLKNHPNSDANKTLQERMDSLNSVLLNFLCYDVRFVWKVHSLSIQGIRKDDYVDEEILSAVFPLSWDFHFRFHEIFNMMEYIILSVMEYSNVVKELIKHPADSQEFSIRYCITYK
ncbi:6236_t:CDS:2 [Entrophospora sp. SA101]|nr:6236_t:CDS:2 [Entrophospora sp. SA101]